MLDQLPSQGRHLLTLRATCSLVAASCARMTNLQGQHSRGHTWSQGARAAHVPTDAATPAQSRCNGASPACQPSLPVSSSVEVADLRGQNRVKAHRWRGEGAASGGAAAAAAAGVAPGGLTSAPHAHSHGSWQGSSWLVQLLPMVKRGRGRERRCGGGGGGGGGRRGCSAHLTIISTARSS